MENLISVSCGFYFENGSVCLIRKTRPEGYAGKLCGPGGKIEPGESPVEAMVREFREETGVATSPGLWTLFCTTRVYVNNDNDTVPYVVYRYVNNQPAYKFDPITQTDEEVGMYPLTSLHWPEVYPTERWLIPMAKDAISHGHVYNVQELL